MKEINDNFKADLEHLAKIFTQRNDQLEAQLKQSDSLMSDLQK